MSFETVLQGEDQIGGVITAACLAAIDGLDGATVDVVAAGMRGQSKNTLIAMVQAKRLRDPFYLDADAQESINSALQALAAKQYSTRFRALTLAGQLMLNAIGRNVDAQRNPDGSGFASLTVKYAAIKRRKYGFTDPILRATGDLLDNLRIQINGLG